MGDFVLSGGELPAVMILDAVTRLLPGALGNEDSSVNESFAEMTVAEIEANSTSRVKALLDFPHYTRPAEFRRWGVPEVLIGGNHAEVAKWGRRGGEDAEDRPDLMGRKQRSGEVRDRFGDGEARKSSASIG